MQRSTRIALALLALLQVMQFVFWWNMPKVMVVSQDEHVEIHVKRVEFRLGTAQLFSLILVDRAGFGLLHYFL